MMSGGYFHELAARLESVIHSLSGYQVGETARRLFADPTWRVGVRDKRGHTHALVVDWPWRGWAPARLATQLVRLAFAAMLRPLRVSRLSAASVLFRPVVPEGVCPIARGSSGEQVFVTPKGRLVTVDHNWWELRIFNTAPSSIRGLGDLLFSPTKQPDATHDLVPGPDNPVPFNEDDYEQAAS